MKTRFDALLNQLQTKEERQASEETLKQRLKAIAQEPQLANPNSEWDKLDEEATKLVRSVFN